jgi:hypothetical protein
MLDMCVNQGAGLSRMGFQAAPCVIAMASHGQQQGELPVLWSLCNALVGLGYPVAVLDATTSESADNPGLDHLLDDAYWQDHDREPQSWTVIPAAVGLQRIGAQQSQSRFTLDSLGSLLQNFGVVLIYAKADTLSRLLPGSGIEPLLTLAPVKMSAITAYQALKHMLLSAKLRSTVANITGEPLSKFSMASHSSVKTLQDCAMTFLDYRIDAQPVQAVRQQNGRSEDMNRLALRLLENAMPLHRHQFVGSH